MILSKVWASIPHSHKWNACVCSICGKVNPNSSETEHQWDDCICQLCNKVRDAAHYHSWQECFCTKCKNFRHQYQENCTCKTCSDVLHVAEMHHRASGRSSYLTKVCKKCGILLHSSTISATGSGSSQFRGRNFEGYYYIEDYFSPSSSDIWADIGKKERKSLLNSFWCQNCVGTCAVVELSGRVKYNDFFLHGKCNQCGHNVAHFVKSDSEKSRIIREARKYCYELRHLLRDAKHHVEPIHTRLLISLAVIILYLLRPVDFILRVAIGISVWVLLKSLLKLFIESSIELVSLIGHISAIVLAYLSLRVLNTIMGKIFEYVWTKIEYRVLLQFVFVASLFFMLGFNKIM